MSKKKAVAEKPQAGTGRRPVTAKGREPALRRTQAERRETTRRKLVEATLRCLARDGYSGTTISRIVEEAGLSHGASGHHFPSKAALLQAATEELMRRAYRQWGKALLNVTAADDRLDTLLTTAWRDVFQAKETDALMELILAGKQEPELNALLQPMAKAAFDAFGQAAEHFFVAKKADTDVYRMMILTQWLFRGMVMDQRLAGGPEYFEPYLKLWKSIMAEHVEARPGVTTPPPRPSWMSDPGVAEKPA